MNSKMAKKNQQQKKQKTPAYLSTVESKKQTKQTRKTETGLGGVAQWIERRPSNQRVAGLIPSQVTYLGCGPGPQ